MPKPAKPDHSYLAAARSRWPQAEWIIGSGRYASVAYCDTTTVMLFATPAEASRAKAFIDRLACGGSCSSEHEIVDLAAEDVPAGTRGAANTTKGTS